jgi:hypothetical protein
MIQPLQIAIMEFGCNFHEFSLQGVRFFELLEIVVLFPCRA